MATSSAVIGRLDKKGRAGAILIVAPNERKVRIEVAYGLEGTLTDAVSKLIIENSSSHVCAPTISPVESVAGSATSSRPCLAIQRNGRHVPDNARTTNRACLMSRASALFADVLLSSVGRRGRKSTQTGAGPRRSSRGQSLWDTGLLGALRFPWSGGSGRFRGWRRCIWQFPPRAQ
jgi:hypothetical protein